MIDFRIQVIRSSRKYDSLLLVFFRVSKSLPSLVFNIAFERMLLFSRRMHGACNLCLADTLRLQNFIHSLYQTLVIVVRHERVREFHAVFLENIVHIVCDNFRIGSNNRAVIMVLCTFVFHLLVIHARIENPFFTHFNQGLNVSVHKFCRITCSV